MLRKKLTQSLAIGSLALLLAACNNNTKASDDTVIIYSNADDEAITIMQDTLDDNGFKSQYKIQPIGTSELGGKMLAEGRGIEADVITMASYYIDSAQAQHQMFKELPATSEPIQQTSSIQRPILGNTGALFINTEALKAAGLPKPTSLNDLTDPRYKNQLSFPNMLDSSTGWLLVQAVLAEYGEKEGKTILTRLFNNAGPHVESSGSGPIKKVTSGEVAIGFGLRAQAVDAKENGLPIDYVDPIEGNYSLVESVAVVDHEENDKEKKAAEMAEVIAEKARPALMEQYPVALYKGETLKKTQQPAHLKQWNEPLSVKLLEQHQMIYKEAKGEN
ncbi:MAG: extracellular solute-binding protein [Candidatus Kurthia intestinigallinarum]